MLDTLGSLRVQKLLVGGGGGGEEGEIILNLLSDLDSTIHSQPFSFWDVMQNNNLLITKEITARCRLGLYPLS